MPVKPISGQRTWDWIVQYWPMDLWATLLVLFAILVICLVYVLKRNPPYKEKCLSWYRQIVGRTVTAFVSILVMPWTVIRGLFFTKNGGPNYYFAPFKSMFVLISLVVIFRVSVGGMSIDRMSAGPDVMSRVGMVAQSIKKASKRSKRGKKTSTRPTTTPKTSKYRKTYRPYVQIQKLSFDPVQFYTVLVLLIFAGLYYFRRDLKEGDNSNLFDKLVEVFGYGLARRYGGTTPGDDKPPPGPGDDDLVMSAPTMLEPAPKSDTTSGGGGRKKKEGDGPPSESDDPFLSALK